MGNEAQKANINNIVKKVYGAYTIYPWYNTEQN